MWTLNITMPTTKRVSKCLNTPYTCLEHKTNAFVEIKTDKFVVTENAMLTKKEKILVHPWTEKRFQAHRRKVISAGPAIDYHAPAAQPHVTVKLKKTQRELERQRDIERENSRLLQRLVKIMNTSRMNNFWRECRPNFLNRELLYPKRRPKTSTTNKASSDTNSEATVTQPVRGQSARCATCSGNPVKRNQIIPEERIPWAPPRVSWNQKLIRKPERVHKCCIYCC